MGQFVIIKGSRSQRPPIDLPLRWRGGNDTEERAKREERGRREKEKGMRRSEEDMEVHAASIPREGEKPTMQHTPLPSKLPTLSYHTGWPSRSSPNIPPVKHSVKRGGGV